MKTKSLLSLVLFVTVFSVNGCSALVIKEARNTASFSKLQIESGIDVYFTQQNSPKIEVEADEDIIKKIITEVKGETLVIKREKGIQFKKMKSVKVFVSAPLLNEIVSSGGSDFYADNLNCDNSFRITASGGSDIHISQLNVSRTTAVTISGGSDCEIKSLQTVNFQLVASGGSDSDIHLNASGNTSIVASGGSDVELSGKAANVTVSASGGSDVDIRKLTYGNLSSNKSGGSDILN
jgi:hypothetical protein